MDIFGFGNSWGKRTAGLELYAFYGIQSVDCRQSRLMIDVGGNYCQVSQNKMTAQKDPRKNPSLNTEDYWIHSKDESGKTSSKRAAACNVGKWLVFAPVEEIDAVWEKIDAATKAGDLGIEAKVSTMKSNSVTGGYSQSKVVCVYTYDWKDEEDVMNVREALRQLGFTQKLYYKTDEATYAGAYVHRGHTRVSKYSA